MSADTAPSLDPHGGEADAAEQIAVMDSGTFLWSALRQIGVATGIGAVLYGVFKFVKPRHNAEKAREELRDIACDEVATNLSLEPHVFSVVKKMMPFRNLALPEFNDFLVTLAVLSAASFAVHSGVSPLNRGTPRALFRLARDVRATTSALFVVICDTRRGIVLHEFKRACREVAMYLSAVVNNARIDAEFIAQMGTSQRYKHGQGPVAGKAQGDARGHAQGHAQGQNQYQSQGQSQGEAENATHDDDGFGDEYNDVASGAFPQRNAYSRFSRQPARTSRSTGIYAAHGHIPNGTLPPFAPLVAPSVAPRARPLRPRIENAPSRSADAADEDSGTAWADNPAPPVPSDTDGEGSSSFSASAAPTASASVKTKKISLRDPHPPRQN